MRAFVALAFGMLIQNGFKIERDFLEPLLLEIHKKSEKKDLGNVYDVIDEINYFAKWDIKI